jgi:hypothetical protein
MRKFERSRWRRAMAVCFAALAVTVVLGVPAKARAGFVVTSGNLTVLNPAAATPVNLSVLDATTSDTNMFGFTERTGVALPGPVSVDFSQPGTYTPSTTSPAQLSQGTIVNSYLFHSEPASETKEANGVTYDVTVKFDQPIVGVQMLGQTLRSYDMGPSGLGNPNVKYPTSIYSGLETSDSVIESADHETLHLIFHTFTDQDQVRVFTASTAAVPEPTSVSLAFTGVLGLGAYVLRRRRKLKAS